MENIKVLCLHGIGGKDASIKKPQWQNQWRDAFEKINFTEKDNVHFMDFDNFFKTTNANWRDYLHFFTKTFRERPILKGMFKDFMDNYPDMVVEFLLEDKLRNDLKGELKRNIEKVLPDVIYAHSLGSLICYDFFTDSANNHYQNITLVTSGSQLGNPHLRNHELQFPIVELPIKFWYNLNNPKDAVFASHPIKPISHNQFKEITTEFSQSLINHNELEYINAEKAKNEVWNIIKKEILTTKSK